MRRIRIPAVVSATVASVCVLATAATAATIIDNNHGNVLRGTADHDTILANGGRDVVRSYAGNDFVDVDTESYRVARDYMVRLGPRDLEDAEAAAKLAAAGGFETVDALGEHFARLLGRRSA